MAPQFAIAEEHGHSRPTAGFEMSKALEGRGAVIDGEQPAEHRLPGAAAGLEVAPNIDNRARGLGATGSVAKCVEALDLESQRGSGIDCDIAERSKGRGTVEHQRCDQKARNMDNGAVTPELVLMLKPLHAMTLDWCCHSH